MIFAEAFSLSTNCPQQAENFGVLSVFFGGEWRARDFYILGQCSGERHHDRKAHEQQRGDQHVALRDIPQHEQERAQGQHTAANGDRSAKPLKKNPFQTRGRSIRFTGESALWAAHPGGSWLAAVWAWNVVRVGFHSKPSILGTGLLGIAAFVIFNRSSSTALVPRTPPMVE